MDIYCRVTDIGLIPMYDSDLDEKHRLRIGDNVLCTIKRPRNYEFHKKILGSPAPHRCQPSAPHSTANADIHRRRPARLSED